MNSFIGFSKGSSIFSRIITLGQLGRYSHCFFALEFNGQWYVIDSSKLGGGVKIRKILDFNKHARMVKKYNLESTEEQKKKVFDLAVSRSYDVYPFRELVGNACQLIVKWFTFGKVKIKNPFHAGEHCPRCHELVAIILRDVYGYKFQVNLDDTDLLWFDDFCESELKNGRV